MNNLFTKELCMYMIDVCDDYFLHHKLLMLSKSYYDYCNANKEQRQYNLICQFQYIEFLEECGFHGCEYKVNGIIHRIDINLPSIIYSDGSQFWYRGDKKHRDNGPAEIHPEGTQIWYRDGKLHRDNDLPAVIRSDGTKEWCQNGKRHRDNGPAILWSDGSQNWFQNDKRHRDNGPAIIYTDGDRYWYTYGSFIKIER